MIGVERRKHSNNLLLFDKKGLTTATKMILSGAKYDAMLATDNINPAMALPSKQNVYPQEHLSMLPEIRRICAEFGIECTDSEALSFFEIACIDGKHEVIVSSDLLNNATKALFALLQKEEKKLGSLRPVTRFISVIAPTLTLMVWASLAMLQALHVKTLHAVRFARLIETIPLIPMLLGLVSSFLVLKASLVLENKISKIYLGLQACIMESAQVQLACGKMDSLEKKEQAKLAEAPKSAQAPLDPSAKTGQVDSAVSQEPAKLAEAPQFVQTPLDPSAKTGQVELTQQRRQMLEATAFQKILAISGLNGAHLFVNHTQLKNPLLEEAYARLRTARNMHNFLGNFDVISGALISTAFFTVQLLWAIAMYNDFMKITDLHTRIGSIISLSSIWDTTCIALLILCTFIVISGLIARQVQHKKLVKHIESYEQQLSGNKKECHASIELTQDNEPASASSEEDAVLLELGALKVASGAFAVTRGDIIKCALVLIGCISLGIGRAMFGFEAAGKIAFGDIESGSMLGLGTFPVSVMLRITGLLLIVSVTVYSLVNSNSKADTPSLDDSIALTPDTTLLRHVKSCEAVAPGMAGAATVAVSAS